MSLPNSFTPARASNFYCEADCMSEGKCAFQCSECAAEEHDYEYDDGEDTNVEDSYGR